MENKKWITFWKKNLSDTLKSPIDIKKLNYFEIENFKMGDDVISESEKINQLIDIDEVRRNKKRGLKDRKNDNSKVVEELHVLIAPIKIAPKEEILPYRNDTYEKLPFWYFAKVDRQGKLHLPDETFPVFQQKFLKFFSNGCKEFVFGTLENVDKVKDLGEKEFQDYSDYIRYLNDVFKQTVGQGVYNYSSSGYEVIQNGVVVLPRKDILLLLESLNFIKKY